MSAVRQQGFNKITEYEEETRFKKERGKDCETNPITGRIPLNSKRELRHREPCSQEQKGGTGRNSTSRTVPKSRGHEGVGKLQGFQEGVEGQMGQRPRGFKEAAGLL